MCPQELPNRRSENKMTSFCSRSTGSVKRVLGSRGVWIQLERTEGRSKERENQTWPSPYLNVLDWHDRAGKVHVRVDLDNHSIHPVWEVILEVLGERTEEQSERQLSEEGALATALRLVRLRTVLYLLRTVISQFDVLSFLFFISCMFTTTGLKGYYNEGLGDNHDWFDCLLLL